MTLVTVSKDGFGIASLAVRFRIVEKERIFQIQRLTTTVTVEAVLVKVVIVLVLSKLNTFSYYCLVALLAVRLEVWVSNHCKV